MHPGPEARLEHLGRLAQRPVETFDKAGRHPAEEGRKRGAGDIVAGFSDGDVLPAVVAALAVEGLFHEGGEGDGALGANQGLEGGGMGREAYLGQGYPSWSSICSS